MGGVPGMRSVLAALSFLLPWPLRRRFLRLAFGFELHPSSRIGLSWTFPRRKLVLEENARIGHLTVIRRVDTVRVGRNSVIGNLNWITAIPTDVDGPVLEDFPDRSAELILAETSGITSRHYIDCSDTVALEPYSIIGGIRCVILTHHIDIGRARQGCAPVRVGRHSFVATNCVLLGGATLPDCSILGANSLLIGDPGQTHRLYGGSPAREITEYSEDHPWFQRTELRTY